MKEKILNAFVVFYHSAMNGYYSVLPIGFLEEFQELCFKQSCQECRQMVRSASMLPWHLSLGDVGAVTSSLTPRFSHNLSIVENHKVIYIVVYSMYTDYTQHKYIFISLYYLKIHVHMHPHKYIVGEEKTFSSIQLRFSSWGPVN